AVVTGGETSDDVAPDALGGPLPDDAIGADVLDDNAGSAEPASPVPSIASDDAIPMGGDTASEAVAPAPEALGVPVSADTTGTDGGSDNASTAEPTAIMGDTASAEAAPATEGSAWLVAGDA